MKNRKSGMRNTEMKKINKMEINKNSKTLGCKVQMSKMQILPDYSQNITHLSIIQV